MNQHNFKVGDVVYILNQTMSGKVFIEGKARIAGLLKNEDQYKVQFLDGNQSKRYERYVDPAAQDDPAKYIDKLNGRY